MSQAPYKRLQLLSEVTTNSTGAAFEWSGTGEGTIHAYGTFDTCTITLQGSTDGGKTWTAYSTTYTAATIASFTAGRILLRGVVSSVGPSTSVSLDLVPAERNG